MAKPPTQGGPGGDKQGRDRPGKESQRHQKQVGPDKLSGGGMPPDKKP